MSLDIIAKKSLKQTKNGILFLSAVIWSAQWYSLQI